MTNDQETIQLPMLIAAMMQALTYNEIVEAKELSKLVMTWTKNPDQRDAIYHKHRNAGASGV